MTTRDSHIGSHYQHRLSDRVSANTEELNAWLLDRCVAYAKANRHPEVTDRTIWQV